MLSIPAFVQDIVMYGTIGSFGGTAHYVYQAARKGRSFSGWGFIANVFLSFFVSVAVVMWLWDNAEKLEFYSLIAGFFAYPILDLADEHRTAILKRLKTFTRD